MFFCHMHLQTREAVITVGHRNGGSFKCLSIGDALSTI